MGFANRPPKKSMKRMSFGGAKALKALAINKGCASIGRLRSKGKDRLSTRPKDRCPAWRKEAPGPKYAGKRALSSGLLTRSPIDLDTSSPSQKSRKEEGDQ